MKKILNKLFRLEEINGHEVCPTYMFRWTLLKIGPYGVYLHKFVASDWSKDFHDHPKRFISIGLKGRYLEQTPNGERVYHAPWVRSFPATHIHRIVMVNGEECWTLCIVLRNVRKWGFWNRGNWIPWRTYVGSATARDRKACV